MTGRMMGRMMGRRRRRREEQDGGEEEKTCGEEKEFGGPHLPIYFTEKELCFFLYKVLVGKPVSDCYRTGAVLNLYKPY